jgi:hypothetical protein
VYACQRGAKAFFTHGLHARLPAPAFRACVQGRVSIPLRQVMERGRVRDTWPLQDVGQGSLTMELSWMGTLTL